MPTPLEIIEAEAMKLSPQERGALADKLVDSLDPVDALGPEWREEIARRVADMEAGRTRFTPADEAMAQLAAHIQSRRSAT